jgi:hypothetical protein
VICSHRFVRKIIYDFYRNPLPSDIGLDIF